MKTWTVFRLSWVLLLSLSGIPVTGWTQQPFPDSFLPAGSKKIEGEAQRSRSLPFTEDWEAGNFTENGWSTVPSDNNWAISMGSGNPSSCADFFWLPHRINYCHYLTSDTMDARAYTCAGIWLAFDLQMITYNPTGTEKFSVEYSRNGNWHQVAEFENLGTTGWETIRLELDSVEGTMFQFRLVVHGENSANVLHWCVDNIRVYSICDGPDQLFGAIQPGRKLFLTWQPPDCLPLFSGLTSLIYDDGISETGLRCGVGEPCWFGNYFPLSFFNTGTIQEVSVYFNDDGSGSTQPLSIDFFNGNHQNIGTTAPFTAGPANTWIYIPVNDVPFTGPVYAMVRFDVPADSYFLASDINGPNAGLDLAWHRDSVGIWQPVTVFGVPLLVFLLRMKVIFTTDGPRASEPDLDVSYNVYRSASGGGPPYVQRNFLPLTQCMYLDTLPQDPALFFLNYYITCIFQNPGDSTVLCEGISDTLPILLLSGGNHSIPPSVRIVPNPASDRVKVTTLEQECRVEVSDEWGRRVFSAMTNDSGILEVDVRRLKQGIYLFRVFTRSGVHCQKVMVSG